MKTSFRTRRPGRRVRDMWRRVELPKVIGRVGRAQPLRVAVRPAPAMALLAAVWVGCGESAATAGSGSSGAPSATEPWPGGGEDLAVGFTSSLDRVFVEPPHEFSGHLADSVALALARNEYEGFQIVLFPGRALADVTMNVSPLVSARGDTIPGEGVRIDVVGQVNLPRPRIEGNRAGWYPDPLLPDRPLDLEPGVPQAFLVTVYAPAGTPPGRYLGEVIVRAAYGHEVRRRLAVTVWSATLPATPRFRTAHFGSWNLPRQMWPPARGHPPLDDERRLEIMLDIAELGFAHRLPPTAYLANGLVSWNQRGSGNTLSSFPTHDRVEGAASRFNAERTDRILDFMLARGANHFFIGVTSDIYRHPEIAAERERRLVAHLRAYRHHLAARGLLHMAYVYNVDEPRNEGIEHAKATYRLIRERVGEDVRILQNTNRDDPRAIPELLGHFDALDVNLGFFDALETDRHRAERPDALDEVWWNLNIYPDERPNLFLEYPLTDARIIGPMSYAKDVAGFEYWQIFHRQGLGDYRPVGPEDLRLRWNVDGRSMDGTLVYPGEDYRVHSSLRLAGLRDGFEDLELLYLLEEAAPDHPLLEVPIARGPNDFSGDAAELLDFRRRVAEALEAVGVQPEGVRRPGAARR